MLLRLAQGAGFDRRACAELAMQSRDELRRMATESILFGTLREFGLTVLLEVTCFEWMLSRMAQPIADLLFKHRGLSQEPLVCFTNHSEVDKRPAAEGMYSVFEYANYYGVAGAAVRL